MKKLFFIIFSISSIFFAQSQNSISGVIVNEQNEPIFGAEIFIEELQIGISSDENGNYSMKNIPNGQHLLMFSFMGFETQQKSLSFYNEDKTLNIQLFESVFQMDEVIVATPFNKLQSENVMMVEHKSVKSLEKKGGTTLIEGVSTIAGVSNMSTGTGIGKPVIRGLSGNRVVTYTQGVRLENYQNGEKHGLGVNESGIESVEVIKGPASLLYGSDALGGVLYLIPEKYAPKNTIQGTVGSKYFSNTLGFNTAAGVKTSSENFKFLINGSYDTHSDYETGNNERVTNSRYNEQDIKAGLGYSLNNFSADLRYNYNQSEIGIPKEIGEQSTSKKMMNLYQDLNYHIISLKNSFVLNSTSIKTNLGYTHNNRKLVLNGEDEIDMVLSTFNYDAKWFLPQTEKFESVVGIQGMTQNNSNYGNEVFLPNAKTNDLGIFGNMNYSWNTSKIQAGLRFDGRKIDSEEHGTPGGEHYIEAIEKSLNSFSGSIGYKNELAQNTILRLNLASGFRAPNLAELASSGLHEGRWEIGNPNLENEQNIQLDLSFEYKRKHFEFFLNSFYNNVYDYIYINPTGEEINDFEVYSYVQNDAELYGGEVGIHLHPHPLDWLHFESVYEMVIGKQKDGEYLPRIPANTFDNTLRAEFDIDNWLKFGYVFVNLESTFAQDNVGEFEDPSDNYNLLNFGLGGDIIYKNFNTNVSFNVKNALNKEYISHLSVLAEEGIANQGINFVFGLKFNF